MFSNNNFKNILQYSYSDDDIRHYLGNDAKIIVYKDLYNYNSIFDLLPEDRSFVVILIETKRRSGHYIVLCRIGTTLYYFDSYGKGVDEELKYINPFWRKELRENEKILSRMIKNSEYQLEYNSRKLQTERSYDDSCGRWCVWFILQFLKGMDIGQFLDYIDYIVETHDYEKYKDLKYDVACVKVISYTPKI